ncbi:MAG: tRNA uridine-5-carboxymethylaminomethyl(34) synthesis GTPase MnmE [Ruminococcaceae bacterium]|nr:tRNA uridine-5-carboxymethylaminomethyl(34) synthesis GTPase MnmE [Oscillospiraceae bacterium]
MTVDHTVAAISTPYGRGGIAVIRISGRDALAVTEKMFLPASGKSIIEYKAGSAVYGKILFEGRQIDTGIATVFRAPHSYTGEDTVEISCHGGILLTEKVLAAVLAAGATRAGPGEFTKRAFLAGKLSLSEAEAVISLIEAEGEEQLKLASAEAKGVLGREIERIHDALIRLVAATYVQIDYPDEDLSGMNAETFLRDLDTVLRDVENLETSYRTGHAVAEGITTVILGKPNTGKSSLLNALAGYDRAIVSSVAGTTRDTVEQKIRVGAVTLTLHDTAGVHDTSDTVEQMGVKRSLALLEKAELILLVLDGSEELDADDKALIERLKTAPCPVICVCNKSDKESRLPSEAIACFSQRAVISAATGEGLDALRTMIEGLFVAGKIDYDQTPILTGAHRHAMIVKAKELLTRARDAVRMGMTPDVAALDLEGASAELGRLDGREVGEEVVDSIFSRFCVGK